MGEEVMQLITELNAEGTTIVMVTHSSSHAEYAPCVVPQIKHVSDLLAQNAELLSRLKLSDEQLRRLQQEQDEVRPLKGEYQYLTERVMLLQEEVRWYKEQFFGRSSQQSPQEMSAEQKMLFNEAEVLAAIEAVEAAHASRTTKIAGMNILSPTD
jgi:ABC-type multidrug transport system ATPase subunit